MILMKKEFYKKIYIYIILLLIIISDCSVYSYKYRNILSLVMMISILPIILFERKIITKKVIIYSSFISIFVFSYLLYFKLNYGVTMISYMIRWIIILWFIDFCIAAHINIIKKTSQLILGITIIELFLFILINILNIPVSYQIINYNGLEPQKMYLGIFFNGPNMFVFNRLVERFQAFFWEPGVYQIFLNFSLLYYIFIESKNKLKKVFILLLAIIFTYSTIAYIIAIIIVIIKILSLLKGKKIKKGIKILILYFIPIILIIGIIVIGKILISKINAYENYGNISYNVRLDDTIDCISKFLDNPILGSGFFNYKILKMGGSVNGLAIVLYQTGIIGFLILILIPVFRINRVLRPKYGVYFTSAFTVWIILSLFNEPISYSNPILMFISYAYMINKKSIDNRE